MDDEHDTSDEELLEGPVTIPHDRLSEEALRGVVEEFITREGTDYGQSEFSLERKVEQVMGQVSRGDAFILFDPTTRSTSVVTRRQLKDMGIGID